MAHTSTSTNYQILASLDLGRRQVALEGVELVQRQIENAMQLRDAIDNHPLLSKYMACLRTPDLIPDDFRPSHIGQPLRSGLRNMMAAWDSDEFVLDPSRITLSIGWTGYDGDTFKREQLMDRHGVQINKTSRNTVLFMTNIGTTRSSVAFLVEVLVKIARELDEHISEMGLGERGRFEERVRRLTASSTSQPDFSGFHDVFRDHSGAEATPEGDVRRAFYLSYNDANCEYLTSDEIFEKLDAVSTWCRRRSSRRIRPGSRAGAPSGVQPRDPDIHPRARHARDPRLPARFRLPGVHGEGDRDVQARRRTPPTGTAGRAAGTGADGLAGLLMQPVELALGVALDQ